MYDLRDHGTGRPTAMFKRLGCQASYFGSVKCQAGGRIQVAMESQTPLGSPFYFTRLSFLPLGPFSTFS